MLLTTYPDLLMRLKKKQSYNFTTSATQDINGLLRLSLTVVCGSCSICGIKGGSNVQKWKAGRLQKIFRFHMHCLELKSMCKTLKQVVVRQMNTGNMIWRLSILCRCSVFFFFKFTLQYELHLFAGFIRYLHISSSSPAFWWRREHLPSHT